MPEMTAADTAAALDWVARMKADPQAVSATVITGADTAELGRELLRTAGQRPCADAD
jgi:hypothetical protein